MIQFSNCGELSRMDEMYDPCLNLQVVRESTIEELMEIVLPRLTKVITLWEFLLMKVEKGNPTRPHTDDVYREYLKLHDHVKRLCQEYLECVPSEEVSQTIETDPNILRVIYLIPQFLNSALPRLLFSSPEPKGDMHYMGIEHNAAFIIMHVPLEFQVEVSNSNLCHHCQDSRISQLKHFSQSSQKPCGVEPFNFFGRRLRA